MRTSNDPWETYWRAGYQVAGSSEVIVTEYGKSRERALKAATDAAVDDQARIIELGISVEVTFWVEKWRVRRVSEFEGREEVEAWKPDARRDPVELGRAGV